MLGDRTCFSSRRVLRRFNCQKIVPAIDSVMGHIRLVFERSGSKYVQLQGGVFV